MRLRNIIRVPLYMGQKQIVDWSKALAKSQTDTVICNDEIVVEKVPITIEELIYENQQIVKELLKIKQK